jgi:ubiquinone/menaquinone biosynthesis C-methylase UbiE
MRLNLACGDDRREGYVNVDLRADVADVVASVDKLPFADDSAEEVVAFDILEHFPSFRTADLLSEWHRVLKPMGALTLKVPNMLALSEWIVAGKQPRLIIRNIMGGHRWGPDGAWDTHHTNWTPTTLREDLAQAGFQVVREDHALNMTFEAVKP